MLVPIHVHPLTQARAVVIRCPGLGSHDNSDLLLLSLEHRPHIVVHYLRFYTNPYNLSQDGLELTDLLENYFMPARADLESALSVLQRGTHRSACRELEYMLNESGEWMAELIVTQAATQAPEKAVAFLKSVHACGFRHPAVQACLDATLELAARVRYREAQARKIQRCFRRAMSDPSHPMCQRRLLMEWEMLVEGF